MEHFSWAVILEMKQMCELSEFGNKTADRGLGCALHPRSARSKEGKQEDAMGRKVIWVEFFSFLLQLKRTRAATSRFKQSMGKVGGYFKDMNEFGARSKET